MMMMFMCLCARSNSTIVQCEKFFFSLFLPSCIQFHFYVGLLWFFLFFFILFLSTFATKHKLWSLLMILKCTTTMRMRVCEHAIHVQILLLSNRIGSILRAVFDVVQNYCVWKCSLHFVFAYLSRYLLNPFPYPYPFPFDRRKCTAANS